MRTLSRSSMIRLLRKRIKDEGTQSKFAAKHGFTVGYLQMVLRGSREFGPKILRVFNAKRRIYYEVPEDKL